MKESEFGEDCRNTIVSFWAELTTISLKYVQLQAKITPRTD